MKTFNFILFDHECWISLFNHWKLNDEEGDFYLSFDLFNFCVSYQGFSITICNFSIQLGWY